MKVLIAGDFCPQERISELIDKGDYQQILNDIKPLLKDSDLSIVNLECPIVEREIDPIIKQGPNLKCSSKALEVLSEAGFNMVTLANNHILDYGEEGIKNTIAVLESNDILHVGAGDNLGKASDIFYYKNNGEKLAIINCCETEFSIATDSSAGANPLNPVSQWYKICEAKEKADYVIVIVHGGSEHCQLPSLRMQQTYRFFVDAGADLVVNHHQHCYSGYEVYNGKPIFYGLGNLCFDEAISNGELWNNGFILKLVIDKSNIRFTCYPYIQCANVPRVILADELQEAHFRRKISELNEVIKDKKRLESSLNLYYQNHNNSYKILLQPYTSRILLSLFYRGFLPDRLSKKKALGYLNFIVCDSHRERLISYLKSRIFSTYGTTE